MMDDRISGGGMRVHSASHLPPFASYPDTELKLQVIEQLLDLTHQPHTCTDQWSFLIMCTDCKLCSSRSGLFTQMLSQGTRSAQVQHRELQLSTSCHINYLANKGEKTSHVEH